jgi:hypothetical protein
VVLVRIEQTVSGLQILSVVLKVVTVKRGHVVHELIKSLGLFLAVLPDLASGLGRGLEAVKVVVNAPKHLRVDRINAINDLAVLVAPKVAHEGPLGHADIGGKVLPAFGLAKTAKVAVGHHFAKLAAARYKGHLGRVHLFVLVDGVNPYICAFSAGKKFYFFYVFGTAVYKTAVLVVYGRRNVDVGHLKMGLIKLNF